MQRPSPWPQPRRAERLNPPPHDGGHALEYPLAKPAPVGVDAFAYPLAKGDTIICAFIQGQQGNWISIAPDGKRCILDRRSKLPLEERAPYVCTIRTTYKGKADGGRDGYIVRPSRPVAESDYTKAVDVDFDRHTIRFEAAYPTAMAGTRYADLKADVSEEAVGRGPDRRLLD